MTTCRVCGSDDPGEPFEGLQETTEADDRVKAATALLGALSALTDEVHQVRDRALIELHEDGWTLRELQQLGGFSSHTQVQRIVGR